MTLSLAETRYDRQERITWWDQGRLAASRVLVVGAGALGNELVKNLALVGVGHVDVIDMDRIEHSNLARCVFFRDGDEGQEKATVLARAANELNPLCTVRGLVMKVQQLGDATLLDYDLVVAGLDNREARLWVNAACRRLGRTWIDGAIEGLQGLARVFPPEGPCYECTLSAADFHAMSHRRSCALLSPEDIVSGKTPTNATTASMIAGVEVQEAIKILVGREDLVALNGRVWRLEGDSMMASVIGYVEDDQCMAHDWWEELDTDDHGATCLDDIAQRLHDTWGRPERILFSDDVIRVGDCPACGAETALVGARSVLPEGAGRCSECHGELPTESTTSLTMDDPLMTVPFQDWIWPDRQFVTFLSQDSEIHVVVPGGSDG